MFCFMNDCISPQDDNLKGPGSPFNFMGFASSISELNTCSIPNKDLFSYTEEGQQKTSYLSFLATFKISPSRWMSKALWAFSWGFPKGTDPFLL